MLKNIIILCKKDVINISQLSQFFVCYNLERDLNMLIIIYMNQFFSAIEAHIDDKCLLDVTEQAQSPYLASLGIDNTIFRLNIENGHEDRFTLDQEITFDAMTIAPDASHCLFGGKNNAVLQFNFADSSTMKLYEAMGNITALKYAPSGKYIAIGSEQGKAIIYEPHTGRRQKCRPGHAGSIYSIALSKSGNLLASIGMDQNVLVYKISESGQPMEVTRYTITKLQKCTDLTCSFNYNETALFVSGAPQLQKLECIQNRWDYSKSKSIIHNTEIIMTQVVKPNTLVTSSYQEVCIWNIKQEEKLFEIQQLCLTRVVPIAGKFYGSYNDGKIYEYKREIREQEPMDIEHESEHDRIDFQQEQDQNEENAGEEQEEAQAQVEQRQYRQHKKSKADKMISCFPQPLISTSTQFYNDSRFLFVSIYGCVIQRQEGDEEKFIEVELEGVSKKQMKFTLAKNKNYSLFSMNELGVAFASDKEFGFRPSSETNNEEWTVEWNGIESIAMGSGWIAAANDSEIKIFDMASHEIRSIGFDRQFVAMRAFENVLAAVYHESVPMWDCQQLSMQLFLVDSQIRQIHMIANAHVPLTPKSLLRWFDFSREGMIFSQDTTGLIRAFSLQTSEWTQISVDSIQEIRKVWLIGIKNHVASYWKTTDTDPEPTVAPRFQVKTSEFSIPTIGGHPEDTQEAYEKLLWRRYMLDHEKARTRLWGHLKITRQKNSLLYYLSESILTEKRIAQMHVELDEKYFPLIEKYLKSKENMRAFLMSQNCIRSLDFSRRLIDLFDYQNQRSLAIQFEEHCDQRQKEADYEQMQIFQFMKLREEAERCIKPRSEDPMRRTASRKAESIPSFSQSYMNSQESMDHSIDRLNTSKMSSTSKNSQNIETDNPFLKKKSNHEALQKNKKEISDQIEKFGIKQKADKRNIQKNISK